MTIALLHEGSSSSGEYAISPAPNDCNRLDKESESFFSEFSAAVMVYTKFTEDHKKQGHGT